MSKRPKRPNLNHARNMDVDEWRARQVSKRLTAYLEQREQNFIREHGNDTEAELLAYIGERARQLRRMPHPLELEGGKYLNERLGDWAALARSLGYAPPGKKQEERLYRRLREQVEADFAKERRSQRAEKQERAAQERKEKRKTEKCVSG